VRFEVLMAVIMKRTLFWDVKPYSPVEVYLLKEHIASIFKIKE
jgi:hypothetical protein